MQHWPREITTLARLLHLSKCQLHPQSPRSRNLTSCSLPFTSASVHWEILLDLPQMWTEFNQFLPFPLLPSWAVGRASRGSPQPPTCSLCLLSASQLWRFFKCQVMWLVCSKPCSPELSESEPKSLESPVGSSSSPCVDTTVGPSPPSFLPLFFSSHACFLDSLSRYHPTPGFQTPCPQFGSLFPRESHASFLTSRYLLTLKPSLL